VVRVSAETRQLTLDGDVVDDSPPPNARTGRAAVCWHAPTWTAGARITEWYERARAEGVES